jgi:predicted phage replisome organizer
MEMRERRYVKFKTDIYDDTKTKIIDQRPERDFIHYFFARSIILAGKADCEGNLYMAKDIPYTIETLATEFNRDAILIKLALDLLIELKMIEVTEDNIYRVKSFVKHQNIKVKEKVEINDKEEASVRESNKKTGIDKKQINDSKIGDVQEKSIDSKNQIQEENETDKKESVSDECTGKIENIRQNQDVSQGITIMHENGEIDCDNITEVDSGGATIDDENINGNQDNLLVLEMKDNKKSKRKKKGESDFVSELAVDELEEDLPILFFSEGGMPPLREGERVVWGQTLG